MSLARPEQGNSRTLVDRDKSMEALISTGEEHLQPLLDLRDYLKEVRSQPTARADKRRNGQDAYDRDGVLMKGTGPFTDRTRRDILRRVLEAQRKSNLSLIEGDELAAIQDIWSREESEPQPVDAVSRIWKEVYMEQPMPGNRKGSDEQVATEDDLLRQVCEQQEVPFEMMRALRDVEEEFGHLKRRHGLPEEMRDMVRQAAKHQQEC